MVLTCTMTRTQTEILSLLSNPQREGRPNVVETFQGFSTRRRSVGPIGESASAAFIQELPPSPTAPSRDLPDTPQEPYGNRAGHSGGGPPDDGDPHQEKALGYIDLYL